MAVSIAPPSRKYRRGAASGVGGIKLVVAGQDLVNRKLAHCANGQEDFRH
jgi:hypothetical protein